MLFKLSGSFFILLSALFFGLNRAYSLEMRKRLLEETKQGCVKIINMLRCSHSPLHECFKNSEGIFKEASAFTDFLTPEKAILKASEENKILTESDKMLFSALSGGMNAPDLEGQIQNFSYFLSELEKNLAFAQSDSKVKGRLIIRTSLLFAMAVVLLLI